MTLKNISIVFAVLMIFNACSSTFVEDFCVDSPDGNIRLEFSLTELGEPQYLVKAYDHEFICNSLLGMFSEEEELAKGFNTVSTVRRKKDLIWKLAQGENKSMRDMHNEMTVNLQNADSISLSLRFRVFNDGIGFRYEYSCADSLTIDDELTQFNLTQNGIGWSNSGKSKTNLPDFKEEELLLIEKVNAPLTFRCEDFYGDIREVQDTAFPEMALTRQDSLLFRSQIAQTGVKVGHEFVSPWRVISIAEDAAGLINSSIILNLDENYRNREAVRPMKYIGTCSGNTPKRGRKINYVTENIIRCIDFAADNNVGGVLIEGWKENEYLLDSVTSYASRQGVMLEIHDKKGKIHSYDASYLCTLPFMKADIKTEGPTLNDCSCQKTTFARKLADRVIIYSPYMTACDLIENYTVQPAFQFFRDLDPDWEWSKALDGEIGEYIVIARRAGDTFFIGAGTDEQAREVTVSLDFLKRGLTYEATVYSDTLGVSDKSLYSIQRQLVTASDSLRIRMAKDGGQAVSFIPYDMN